MLVKKKNTNPTDFSRKPVATIIRNTYRAILCNSNPKLCDSLTNDQIKFLGIVENGLRDIIPDADNTSSDIKNSKFDDVKKEDSLKEILLNSEISAMLIGLNRDNLLQKLNASTAVDIVGKATAAFKEDNFACIARIYMYGTKSCDGELYLPGELLLILKEHYEGITLDPRMNKDSNKYKNAVKIISIINLVIEQRQKEKDNYFDNLDNMKLLEYLDSNKNVIRSNCLKELCFRIYRGKFSLSEIKPRDNTFNFPKLKEKGKTPKKNPKQPKQLDYSNIDNETSVHKRHDIDVEDGKLIINYEKLRKIIDESKHRIIEMECKVLKMLRNTLDKLDPNHRQDMIQSLQNRGIYLDSEIDMFNNILKLHENFSGVKVLVEYMIASIRYSLPRKEGEDRKKGIMSYKYDEIMVNHIKHLRKYPSSANALYNAETDQDLKNIIKDTILFVDQLTDIYQNEFSELQLCTKNPSELSKLMKNIQSIHQYVSKVVNYLLDKNIKMKTHDFWLVFSKNEFRFGDIAFRGTSLSELDDSKLLIDGNFDIITIDGIMSALENKFYPVHETHITLNEMYPSKAKVGERRQNQKEKLSVLNNLEASLDECKKGYESKKKELEDAHDVKISDLKKELATLENSLSQLHKDQELKKNQKETSNDKQLNSLKEQLEKAQAELSGLSGKKADTKRKLINQLKGKIMKIKSTPVSESNNAELIKLAEEISGLGNNIILKKKDIEIENQKYEKQLIDLSSRVLVEVSELELKINEANLEWLISRERENTNCYRFVIDFIDVYPALPFEGLKLVCRKGIDPKHIIQYSFNKNMFKISDSAIIINSDDDGSSHDSDASSYEKEMMEELKEADPEAMHEGHDAALGIYTIRA